MSKMMVSSERQYLHTALGKLMGGRRRSTGLEMTARQSSLTFIGSTSTSLMTGLPCSGQNKIVFPQCVHANIYSRSIITIIIIVYFAGLGIPTYNIWFLEDAEAIITVAVHILIIWCFTGEQKRFLRDFLTTPWNTRIKSYIAAVFRHKETNH